KCLMPFVAYYINWVLLFVMHMIMTPVEEGIKKGYFNEAKRILDEDTRLIKIGITGSYGKTSSKNILQEILSEKYYSLMTPASYNTPMGITRTVREMLKPVHEVFVCEMGADKVGDIQELTDFVKPSIGLVTSIGPQHLSTFKSMDNIIKEKMKMIENLPSDGIGIINRDNEYIRNYEVKNNCKLVSYGIHEKADYFGDNIHYTARGSKFDVIYEGESYPFETRLLGEHNIQNILAAIAIGRCLNVSWKELQAAVKKVKYVEHRMEVKVINGYTFIDDAFNSNPVGSARALDVMSRMEPKRFIVTPGMIELGEQEYELNKAFGKKMKGCVDAVVLVGIEQTKAIYEGLQEAEFDMNEVYVVATVKEAFRLIYQKATPSDTILLENDLPDAFNV
ncbi:MAG: UDP-N-acetylmuramoyl-tripeptide--D-alanyl-D-alanine ligase, partial [Erysipelotrichaceae bacterium]|nr:UDP-N-acetylmuramoyl-tripeptide--D-alanyl-D-alanine ligase [Erysipelotrichaceae bacterium]